MLCTRRLTILHPERAEAQRVEWGVREVVRRIRRRARAPYRAARAAAIRLEGRDDVHRVAVDVGRRKRLLEEQRAVVVVDLVVDEPRQLLTADDALGVVDRARLDDYLVGAGDDA